MSSVQYQHFHNIANVRMKLKNEILWQGSLWSDPNSDWLFKRALASGIRNAVDMQNIIIIQS